jgi:DNA replication protein DnaC
MNSAHKKYYLKVGIPRRYLDATPPKKFNPEESYFFLGGTGVGKTHLMASLAIDLLTKKSPCKLLFVNCPELLLEIKSCYNGKSTLNENEILKKYSEVDYLFLDDLGSERVTDWSDQILYLILNKRYEDMRHTCISSNYSTKELMDWNKRISSRILQMCKSVKLSGKDRRLEDGKI